MKKIQRFFLFYWDSLIPQYPFYHWLLKQNLLPSIGYFTAMILLTYYIYITGILFMKEPIQHTVTTAKAFSHTLSNYPKDLTIHIDHGIVTTTYDRPYFLWYQDTDGKKLLAVVDTSASPKDIQQYSTRFLLTNTAFVSKTGRGTTYEYIPLPKKVSITPQAVETLSRVLNGIIPAIPVFMLIGMYLIIPYLLLIATFILVVVVSVLVYALSKHFHSKITYKKTLVLSLHAATFPVLLVPLMHLMLGIRFPISLFSLLVLFYALCAVYEAYGDHAKHHQEALRLKRYQ